LSKALEGFGTSIYSYDQVATAKTKVANQETLALDEAKIGNMTKDQIFAARKDGTLPAYADHLRQAGIDGIVGGRRGQQEQDLMQDYVKTQYDPAKDGDLDGFISKWQQKTIADEGMNTVMATQFLRQTAPVKDWAVGALNDQKNQQITDDSHTSAYTLIQQTVDAGVKAGDSPEKVQQSVRAQYANLGQKGILGLRNKDIDATVLAVARDNAVTNPEHAIALMQTESTAPDGTKVGFLTNPNTADQAQAIIAGADKAISARAERKWNDDQGKNGAAAILAKNYANVDRTPFMKPDGSMLDPSDADFNKRAVKGYLDVSPQVAKERHESPAQTTAREFNDLRSAGLNHPKLEAQVNGIAKQLSPSVFNDPDRKAQLLGKLKTGQWMLNESQASLHAYTKDQNDVDAVSIFNEIKNDAQNDDGSGYSDEQALKLTMEAVNPVIKPDTNFTQADHDAVDSQLGSIAAGEGLFGWGGGSPANYNAVKTKVEYLARAFIASGLSSDQAITRAAKSVQKSSLIYNGVMLPKINGFDAGDDFVPTVRSYVNDFASKNPKTLKDLDIGADDIAILPMGNVNGDSGGHFSLVTKHDLTPILDENHNQVIFNANDLRNKRATETDIRRRKAISDAAKR
jgi:hypothetical protein